MEYSLERAQHYVGKRVVVSLRQILADGSDTYTGFWGVVESAHADGLLLRIEGGSDASHWAIPPDLDAFEPAEHSHYELEGAGQIVTNVDYEMYWAVAENPEALE